MSFVKNKELVMTIVMIAIFCLVFFAALMSTMYMFLKIEGKRTREQAEMYAALIIKSCVFTICMTS